MKNTIGIVAEKLGHSLSPYIHNYWSKKYNKNFKYQKFEISKNVQFGHGKKFKLKNGVNLVGCYHPSPRNVNTGRINEKKMLLLLNTVKKVMKR